MMIINADVFDGHGVSSVAVDMRQHGGILTELSKLDGGLSHLLGALLDTYIFNPEGVDFSRSGVALALASGVSILRSTSVLFLGDEQRRVEEGQRAAGGAVHGHLALGREQPRHAHWLRRTSVCLALTPVARLALVQELSLIHI